MTRPSQVQRLALLGATSLLTLTAASAADISISPTKPNVVFIIADDVGRNLGCYGDTMAKTPNINDLAQSGVKFTRAYGQGAVCTPSRNSFLSGLSTQKTGIHGNYESQKKNWSKIRQMQSVFKAHGYYTVGIGKIGHGLAYEEPNSWNLREEFNQYGPTNKKAFNYDLTPENGIMGVVREENTDGSIFQRMRLSEFKDNAQTRDESRASYFINFLKNRNTAKVTDPFFAAIGFHGGHDPQQYHTSDYADAIKDKTFTTTDAAWLLKPNSSITQFNPLGFNFFPWQSITDAQADVYMKGYYAAVHHMDKQVGKVLDTLKDLKLDQNTIVVFIGDNGYNLGFRGQWAKHNLYADVIHLPLIVKGPGITANLPPASARSDDGVVEYLDIFPTLVELTGLLSTTNNGSISTGITDWPSGQPGRSNGGTDLTTIATPAVPATLTTPAIPAVLENLALDGRSFAARLTNPSNTTGKDAAYVEWNLGHARISEIVKNKPTVNNFRLLDGIPETGGAGRAIYTSTHCYVEYYGTNVKELFDLTADPHCYNDLLLDPSAAHQTTVDTLAQRLHAYFPLPANAAPVAMAISATTIAGTALDLKLTGTDKGGCISTFVAPQLELIGGITFADGTYTQKARYAPAIGFTGNFTTQVTAIDNLGKRSAPATVTITVTGTPPKENAAPVAPDVPNQTAMVGEVFSLSVPAFPDANRDALTYAAIGLPAGLAFNAATRDISGQPTMPGSARITVTATDPSLAHATATFTLTVLPPGELIYGSVRDSVSPTEGFQSTWVLTKRISSGSNTTDRVSATSQDLRFNGTSSLKALLGLNDECGLASSNNINLGFSTAPYAGVSFWINGGPNGGQQVAMAVNRLAGPKTDGRQTGGLQQKVPVTLTPLPRDTWQRVIIPLSNLGANRVDDFRAFRFYNQTTNGTPEAFFIDDVMLLNTAQMEFLLPKSGG